MKGAPQAKMSRTEFDSADWIDLDETTRDGPKPIGPAGFDDLVPSGSAYPCGGAAGFQHDVEARVLRQLTQDTALEFDSLTVRRLTNGLLVEGTVRGTDGQPESEDLSELVRQIADVSYVENRLIVRP